MKNLKKHISKIGITITLLFAALILYFAVRESQTATTLERFSIGQDVNPETSSRPRWSQVNLTADQFNPSTGVLTGSAEVEMHPLGSRGEDGNYELRRGEPQNTQAIKNVLLHFNDARQESDGKMSFLVRGRSEIIKLERVPMSWSVAGKSSYQWETKSLRSSFWYPFDKYSMIVNPNLLIPNEQEDRASGTLEYINLMELDLKVPNLRMDVVRHQVSDPRDDRYEVLLSRPFVLRFITALTGVLALLWLIYLGLFADVGSYVGQMLTFLLGLWGVRATLLDKLAVFPVLLDYLTLTLAFIAVGIIVSRWLQQQQSSSKCPHCTLKISPAARRCPHCTAELAVSD